MIKTLFDHSGFKWMGGGLVLGAILGICFYVLLSPGGAGRAAGRPEAAQGLKEALQQSQALASEGKSAEAAKILEKLVERYPGSPEAYNNLAALQASQGELESSRELLEKGLRTNESYAAIYENLGVVYSEIARSSYGKALRLELPPSAPQLKVLTHLAPAATTARAVALSSSSSSSTPLTPSAPSQAASSATAPQVSPAVAAVPTPAKQPETVLPPPAFSKPTSSPPAQEPASSRKAEEKEMLKALHGWAKAWSNQDADAYLSFYSRKFEPESGLSRNVWEKQREQRLERPSWIKVSLHNIILDPKDPDTVEVKLIQDYRADTFRDRARKTMTLVREDGAWRIQSENIPGRGR